MKIVLTCGQSYSGYQLAHELLISAGLAQARLQQRHGSLSIEELRETPEPWLSKQDSVFTEERYAELFMGREDYPASSAATIAANGKAMHDFAAELLMSNHSQKDWGWSDGRAAWLLEFWKAFDPRIRFTLVYSPLEFAVGHTLQSKIATFESIDQAIASWVATNTEILRFYNRNPERCLLVNALAVIHTPSLFIDKAAARFGLDIDRPDSSFEFDRTAPPAIASSLAKDLIEGRVEAMALYHELESTADIDSAAVSVREADKRHASQEYVDMLSHVEQVAEEARQHAEQIGRLHQERDAAQRTIMELESRLSEIQRSRDAFESEALRSRTASREIGEKNELFLLQVHEVQEEVERYLLQCDQLRQGVKRPPCPIFRPSEIIFDLRREFDGDNWYYSEVDGRWAGPGKASSVKLPVLPSGEYEMQLTVVDAMEPEILNSMEVLVNGTKIDTSLNWQGYPAIVQGQFAINDVEAGCSCEFQFRFAKSVSPAQHGSDDQRFLAIRARSLRLSVIQ